MNFTDKIFEKSTIRGIADYLLYGFSIGKDDRSYKERLDEAYERFEKAVEMYEEKANSDLLDLANEITSETASVYTEIGIQAGMLIIKDILENISVDKEETSIANQKHKAISRTDHIISDLYSEWIEQESSESLRKNDKYCRINEEISRRIIDINNMELNQEERENIDRVFECVKERSIEYGKTAYEQGFRKAMRLMKKWDKIDYYGVVEP